MITATMFMNINDKRSTMIHAYSVDQRKLFSTCHHPHYKTNAIHHHHSQHRLLFHDNTNKNRSFMDHNIIIKRNSIPTMSLFYYENTNNDNSNDSDVDIEYIKTKLIEYLEKRKELNADESAKENIGKIVGGTKGNVILEYISGAPNKPTLIEQSSNPLDYDELTKYGYRNLITPIMKAGGRLRMYEILGIDPPTVLKPKKVKEIPKKIVIDRDGTDDPKRYTGLKLRQVYDDNFLGEKLQQVTDNKNDDNTYEIPFSEKRNTLPKGWTPDWTVERLDEYTKRQGEAQSWVRKAKDGEFIQDPYETFYFDNLPQLLFCIMMISGITISYGQSTPTFVSSFVNNMDDTFLRYLQGPANVSLLISIGSSMLCTYMASQKNRNVIMWLWKGLLGGPFTVQSIKSLDALVTQGEKRKRQQE